MIWPRMSTLADETLFCNRCFAVNNDIKYPINLFNIVMIHNYKNICETTYGHIKSNVKLMIQKLKRKSFY